MLKTIALLIIISIFFTPILLVTYLFVKLTISGGIFEIFCLILAVALILTWLMFHRVKQDFNVETVGVNVYWDKSCTKKVSNISWGTKKPGTKKELKFYVRNEGWANSTLSLATKRWSPQSASKYITLSWNCEGKKLSPGEVAQATLTLKISPHIKNITDFSFDIIVKGKSL